MTKSEFIEIVSEYVGEISFGEEGCSITNRNELIERTEIKSVECSIRLTHDDKSLIAEEKSMRIIGGFCTQASEYALREFLEKFNFQKKGKPHLQQMIMDVGE